MCSCDDLVVVAALDGELHTEPKAVDVRLGWVAEEDIGDDLCVLGQLLLVRPCSSELKRAKEASCRSRSTAVHMLESADR